jgi:hypothetical protein
MRALSAIGAAFVIACLTPAASRADAPGPGPAAAAPAAPGCKCPQVRRARPHRHVRHYRRARPRYAVVPAPPPLLYYNTGIPSPYDTAYDRAMTLHFRTPFVTGHVDPEPGYPHTPPVFGVQPYRFVSGPAVYQYDGLIGEYVELAQYDAHRALPAAMTQVPLVPPR